MEPETSGSFTYGDNLMKIYIIRHGETNSNREGRLQGRLDDVLNDFGVELAELTGKALKGTHFDAAFSSPLSRARATAEIILKQSENDCPIIFDDRILEISMGDWEGKKFKPGECEVDEKMSLAFIDNPLNVGKFPNGESVRDVMERTQNFLKEIAGKEYENVLVSTHGCALRCMLNFLYQDKNNFWHGHVPYNCCLNIVEAQNGILSLVGDDVILYDKSLCIDRYA